MEINAVIQKGTDLGENCDEVWKNRSRKHLDVVFYREDALDRELYSWIQRVAADTNMAPSAVVKIAIRAGKTAACQKAREYSRSVGKARAKLHE